MDDEKIEYCANMLKAAEEKGVKLLLPVDTAVAASFPDPIDAPIEVEYVESTAIPAEKMGLDIGPKTSELVAMQTKIALCSVSEEELKRVIIAYEPVWAIGTGKTATAEQANEVCHTIRECIASVYSQAAADGITIQYGGSMNAGNAAELLAQPDVDGGLIGGASLKPQDFATIVKAATEG